MSKLITHCSIIILLLGAIACVNHNGTFEEMLASMYYNTVPLVKADSMQMVLVENSAFIILDTRPQREYEVAHLPNAKRVGYKDFDINKLSYLDKDQKILVYCSVGYRSERVGEQLQEEGFTQVYNLYGGIFDWKNKGYIVHNANQLPTDTVHAYSQKWGKWLKNGVKVYE
ncbi:MAG: rhodanese-like domain-containing protein [Saprospiraceae bacterium]|nr:rhodanese-like domain-containing protein [Saprospiraceae bacterium]